MYRLMKCSGKRLRGKYRKLLFVCNIPSITALIILTAVYLLILRTMEIPLEIYRLYFGAAYICAAYAFIVTLAISIYEDMHLKGHEKYTYFELDGGQMVVSEYSGTARIDGRFREYRKIWVVNLADVEEVICSNTKIRIKGKARKIEQRADWTGYERDENGKCDFDYWWYNEDGGEHLTEFTVTDNYFYSESIARRIIFYSQKQKLHEEQRAQFHKKLMQIAAEYRAGKRRKKKKAERVFRGYEFERKF